MCSIDALQRTINVVVLIKALVGIIIVIIGGIMAANIHFQQAYGNYFAGTTVIAVFVGFGSLVSVYPLYFAIKRHNRFLCLLSLAGDVVITLVLISVGSTAYTPTIPLFDKALQTDCLKAFPVSHTEKQCEAFLKSDRTAGFRLVWASYFSDPEQYFTTMTNIERTGSCCGFGPPFRCRNDTRSFPDSLSVAAISATYTSQRQKCGHHYGNTPRRDWYPAQYNCLDYYNEAINPPIVGGCKYDLGVGDCVGYSIDSFSVGCASVIEDSLAQAVLPGALFILGSSVMNVISIIICAIMFFKRKHADVFPSYEAYQIKIKYKDVPDPFEVRPQKDVLYKRDFLDHPQKKTEVIRDTPAQIGGSVASSVSNMAF